MTYNEFIQNIIDTRGQWNIPDNDYKERHHIIPKCMGGSNNKENIIWLYAKEHFIAHKLLAEENPDNHSLVYAFNMMVNASANTNIRDYEILPEEYELSKRLLSKVRSDDWKGDKNPNFGKDLSGPNSNRWGKKHTLEARRLNSEKHKGISPSNKGIPMTDEQKQKLSKIRKESGCAKGNKNPAAKKLLCIETGEIFDYGHLAAIKYNISSSAITKSNKSGKPIKKIGLTFKYVMNM